MSIYKYSIFIFLANSGLFNVRAKVAKMNINQIFLILYVNALWSTMGVDAKALHIGFYGKISFA